eukprot:g7572.t1
MPQETYLERKLRQLGLSPDHSNTSSGPNIKRMTFRLYFPRPPYGPVEYLAAKQGDGLNFVGQLLGHGGCTLKRIQTDSGTRVEVHDGKGNLNGTHPSYTDPSLHAIVFAENREKLSKAAKMIAEVLSPVNGTFESFEVIPGGSALLRPAVKSQSKKSVTAMDSVSSTGCESDHTPDENDALQAPNLDSNSVHEKAMSSSTSGVVGGPWKAPNKVKRVDSETELVVPLKVKPDQNEKVVKKEIERVKSWNTWGQNKQDAYSQFTALTQNLVSHYANQSKMMMVRGRNHQEQRILTENGLDTGSAYMETKYQDITKTTSPWKQSSESIKSNFGHGYPHFEEVSGGQEIGLYENMPQMTESCPLPNLYEDLTGGDSDYDTHGKLKDSRFVYNSHMALSMDSSSSSTSSSSKMKTKTTPTIVHRGVCLPHNI